MGNELKDLREHAERCRRLAQVVEHERNKRQLLELAVQLDEQANKIERSSGAQRLSDASRPR